MTIGWVDNATLSGFVRDHLQISQVEELKPYWDSIITQSLKSAYWSIVSAFVARGYSKAQVDQWDRGAEFQQDIAAWWCLQRLGAVQPNTVGQMTLDTLDRRKELTGEPPDIFGVVLTINGVVQEPAGTFGQVNFGAMTTDTDLFVEDLEDVRRGEVTRF